MKHELLLKPRLKSGIVDMSIVLSFTLVLQYFAGFIYYLSFFPLLLVIFMCYYCLTYLFLAGQSLGKVLYEIKLVNKDNAALTPLQIILREILTKVAVGVVFPSFLLTLIFHEITLFHYDLLLLSGTLIFSFIHLCFSKTTWWDVVSRTQIVRFNTASDKRLKVTSFISLAMIFAGLVVVFCDARQTDKKRFVNTFIAKYPVNTETLRYKSFITSHSQEPKDYILSLFDKYDLVVLSERLHPEYSQYELLFGLVNDERFIKKVGNIFTECGSISFQDTLDSYLNKEFQNDELMDRATADLQRNSNSIWPLWTNTNFFDFLKTVNKVNVKLQDTSKINWYFTGEPVDWQSMNHEKYLKAYANPNSERLMAMAILNVYNNILLRGKRKKALVIMNTRHGYGYISDKVKSNIRREYNNSVTAFLMRSLNGKVANVMINAPSIKYYPIWVPVQHGKWDRAFEIAGNPDIGFNLKDSPFGNDRFDVGRYSDPDLKYEDVFTGFIFYKPLSAHIKKDGFPYQYESFGDSILKRASYVSESLVESFKDDIHRKSSTNQFIQTEAVPYAVFSNLIYAFLVPLFQSVSFILIARNYRKVMRLSFPIFRR